MASSVERVVAGAGATISFQGVDQYGEPGDPGAVTVEVVRANGDNVLPALTAASGSSTSPRTATLTAAQTVTLDQLTAIWTTTGGVEIGQSTIDVVGGVYVSQAAADDVEPTLAAAVTTAALFRQARSEVEDTIEDACRQAFVPRFSHEHLTGNGRSTLAVRWPLLRAVSWLYIDGTEVTDLSDITVSPGGIVTREAGWPCGADIHIGYTHGHDAPPADVRKAAIHAIRYQANELKSGITDRAVSFQPVDGGNIVIATPGLGNWVFGIPAVDEVLIRRRWPSGVA